MTALDPGLYILHHLDSRLQTLVVFPLHIGCGLPLTHQDTKHPPSLAFNPATIMSIPRALRPASRRILSARPVAAMAVPARWQSNNSGPFDPVPGHEMAVGELEGAKFRIEPLRRTGEDAETMRARLTCTRIPLMPPPVGPGRHHQYVSC